MKWVEKLQARLSTHTKSAIAKACGFPEARISQILGREQIPNAIDAVTLCRVLGTTVEDIFGDDAKPVPRNRKQVTLQDAERAAEIALEEALENVRAARARAHGKVR